MEWFEWTREDSIRVVARLAGALATGGFLAWTLRRALRTPARSRDQSDVLLLEYAPALRWLFPIVGIGFATLYGVVTRFNPAGIEDPDAKLFAPTLLILAMTGIGFLETWLVKIELSDYGLLSRSPWTGTRRIAWGEVEEVHFHEGWQWFVVRGLGGRRIHLHALLSGLSSFRMKLRERVERERFRQAEPYLAQLPMR